MLKYLLKNDFNKGYFNILLYIYYISWNLKCTGIQLTVEYLSLHFIKIPALLTIFSQDCRQLYLKFIFTSKCTLPREINSINVYTPKFCLVKFLTSESVYQFCRYHQTSSTYFARSDFWSARITKKIRSVIRTRAKFRT